MPAISVLVVTSTDEEGEMVAADLARNMAQRFGGVSIYEGSGRYVDNAGFIVQDRHFLVKTYLDSVQYIAGKAWAMEQAENVRELLGEESVAVVFSPDEHMTLVYGEARDGHGSAQSLGSSLPAGV